MAGSMGTSTLSSTLLSLETARNDSGFDHLAVVKFHRVPGSARRSNQSILKEINSEYSLKGLMLKPKLQHFGHLMQRADSLED